MKVSLGAGTATVSLCAGLSAQAGMTLFPEYKEAWLAVFWVSTAFMLAILLLWTRDGIAWIERTYRLTWPWAQRHAEDAQTPPPPTIQQPTWQPGKGGIIHLDLSNPAQKPIPDWPIRDLFFHICPDLKNPSNAFLCDEVGLEVMDKFSIGQLKIWGRVVGRVGSPLEPILSSYWSHAEFTYLFLGNEDVLNQVTSTRLRLGHEHTGQPSYRDLQVNKAEALSIAWSTLTNAGGAQIPSHNGDTPVHLTPHEVVHYLVNESQWGALKAAEITPEGMKKNVMLEAPLEFKKRAEEGKIKVYGASSITHTHELIPKTFWMSSGLDISTVFDSGQTSRTAAATFEAAFAATRSGIPSFSDLKIEAEDVYRTWPKRAAESFLNRGTSMPLRDAALLAYDELEGTHFREQADRWDEPEQRLEIIAHFLAHNAQIWGRVPPSQKLRKIGMDEFKSGTFKNGGNSYHRAGQNHDAFIDLSIREEDLRDAVKRMTLP